METWSCYQWLLQQKCPAVVVNDEYSCDQYDGILLNYHWAWFCIKVDQLFQSLCLPRMLEFFGECSKLFCHSHIKSTIFGEDFTWVICSIINHEICKILTGEDWSIISHNHVWQSMSWEDESKFFNCHDSCDGTHWADFKPLRMGISEYQLQEILPKAQTCIINEQPHPQSFGHSQWLSGAVGGLFHICWQEAHLCTCSSIHLSKPGHHTHPLATLFRQDMPGCDSWSSFTSISYPLGGIITHDPQRRHPFWMLVFIFLVKIRIQSFLIVIVNNWPSSHYKF